VHLSKELKKWFTFIRQIKCKHKTTINKPKKQNKNSTVVEHFLNNLVIPIDVMVEV